MRVAEIMDDYQKRQSFIASISVNPSAEEYNEEGYAILRRCVAESQVLLAQPFQAQNGHLRDAEQVKVHLKR